MKTLLLVPLVAILGFPFQQQGSPKQDSLITVLGFKWSRTHEKAKTPDTSQTAPPTPAREMIPANKYYARNARINDPMGARDPNEDTTDGRSAALEKITQESRTPTTQAVDAYTYLARIQNASSKAIDVLFWEYEFIDRSNPASITRRQFLCGVNIKPSKEKELQAFSLNGPSDVVSAGSLANASDKLFEEKVVINRVEYADGSVWQRKDWNAAEIKLTYQHAIATPWNPGEMCRGL